MGSTRILNLHKITNGKIFLVTQKEYIYKFIILLDARNPNSIKQMKDGCKPFIPQLEKILNTKDSLKKVF